jgi:cation diffusion facilitator family transporter
MTRRTALRRVGIIILAANGALALAKAGVFVESGSLAVGSEAVNSFTDTAYSLIIVGGLYLTTKPPDFEHPHGHERIEPFVSLFVALGIFAAGAIVLWRATSSLWTGDIAVARGPPAVIVLGLSAGVKYSLYRYCLQAAVERRSPALRATALDNRNDIFASGAALLGVVGAAAGYPILDPLAAVVVALFVLYTGVEVVRDNVDYLVGAAPPDDLRTEILERALGHPEVQGAHDVVAHYVGPEIDVSLHIEVEGNQTLLEAHDIETEIIESIGAIPEIDDVFVHVDPKEAGEWKPDDDIDRLADPDPHLPSDDSDLSREDPEHGDTATAGPTESAATDSGSPLGESENGNPE